MRLSSVTVRADTTEPSNVDSVHVCCCLIGCVIWPIAPTTANTASADDARTGQVANDIAEALQRGRSCLAPTRWTAHVAQLADALQESGHDPVILRGGMGARARAHWPACSHGRAARRCLPWLPVLHRRGFRLPFDRCCITARDRGAGRAGRGGRPAWRASRTGAPGRCKR